MLRRIKYNLNSMSHDTAIQMIRRAMDHHKINVREGIKSYHMTQTVILKTFEGQINFRIENPNKKKTKL